MELLDGLDLDTLVQRFGPVPPERAVHLLSQVCLSLAEAHHHGLVHRDIKPANIYACRVGLDHDFVKVLDFGLVKPRYGIDPEATKLTVDTQIMGTPAFMAPETATGDEATPQTDLYSLGCVGYWLVTGHPVFEGPALQVLMDHVRTDPIPPSQRSELEIPSELERILLWCMEKDQADRPASASQIAQQLHLNNNVRTWTQESARDWWSQNLPASIAETH